MDQRLAKTTQTLKEAREGSDVAEAELSESVYARLRDLAVGYMSHERRGHTLQPTALVHEAYLSLVDQSDIGRQDRTHFLSTAALAMRRVLVHHARKKNARKRGGDRERVPLRDTALQDMMAVSGTEEIDVLALDEALNSLTEKSERRARVVELRFFAGLEFEEIAEVLGTSRKTAEADWYAARAWLHRELSKE